jgi:hypothetical protein
MAYQIEKKDGFFEIRITGATSKYEIFEVIKELDRLDHGKKFPDLWVIARESKVPLMHLAEIAQGIRALLPRDAAGNKSALIADGEFHKAQLEMYRADAAILPFEIRVFDSYAKAVKWLTTPDT